MFTYAWYDDVGIVGWVEFLSECHGACGVGVGASGVHGCACYFVYDIEVFPRDHAKLGSEVAWKYEAGNSGVGHVDVAIVGAEVVHLDVFCFSGSGVDVLANILYSYVLC